MAKVEADIPPVHALTTNVHGWLSRGEGALLYSLARAQSTGVIVEIGSWKGRSTIYLAAGSLAGSRLPVFAIDPHTGSEVHRERYGQISTFEEFQHNIRQAGVEDVICPLVMPSNQAAATFSRPISLLFIDGEHAYESVREDYDLWHPLVQDGGWLAFHDSRKAGPRRVIHESILSSRDYADLYFVDSITAVRKVASNTARQRMNNRLTFLKFRLGHGALAGS